MLTLVHAITHYVTHR